MTNRISSAQKAINFLVKHRDIQYLQAVHSNDTAKFVKKHDSVFMPGSIVFQSLKKNTKSVIACNVVTYNQIEGHIRAAMEQNAILVLEVARSQLSYALNEKKVIEYIKKIIKKTDCDIPIVVHGDHIQYTAGLFNQKAILAQNYKEKTGESFDESLDLEKIDIEIFKSTQKKLKQNTLKGRKDITKIIQRLIKAGFTSIAIDASTIYDEIAGDAVIKYYENHGTEAEKLIIKLEKNFSLSLDWSVDILKLDIKKDKNKFDELKENTVANMKKRMKTDTEIGDRINELERLFGVLGSEARKYDIKIDVLSKTYDKIMLEVSEATIAGKLKKDIKDKMGKNEKLLLLPTSNAKETAVQLKEIKKILRKNSPKMINTFGIEVEVGHVDKKMPNPRLGGKMEPKKTHPSAVKTFGEYLKKQKLRFDLIATNNGSGHGTEFDKESLTPISQVDKISPFLTKELQQEAKKFGATLAQHGTSGSDMDELSELSRKGVIKFNIATNYQHILLNVLSLLHDEFKEDGLMNAIWAKQTSLMSGLEEKTRENIKSFAKEVLANKNLLKEKTNDSLFIEFLKKTHVWAEKKGKISKDSAQEDIATILAKEFKRVLGIMNKKLFLLGTNPKLFILSDGSRTNKKDNIAVLTSSLTAALLTKKKWRGKAVGLDKNILLEKMKISKIKDKADGLAKQIYEKIIKENNTILAVRASEGFGRDGVLESFKANEIIIPDEILKETDNIKQALDNNKQTYSAKNGQTYKIENAIIDVIENTNSFVTNLDNKKIEDLKNNDTGASSIMVIGNGVGSIGNIPDFYSDSIFTVVKKENRQQFIKKPLDPEASAREPKKQLEVLKRIARANDLSIDDLEIIMMDRERENERLAELNNIQKKFPGLKITLIKDGTVSHGILASLGSTSSKHKIMMTVGAAPESFYNLAVSSLFKKEGAIGSLRVYSKNANKNNKGGKTKNLKRRYNFDKNEIKRIKELRPHDSEEIIKGKKLFTQEDIIGDIRASFAMTTNTGVFGINGVEKLPQEFYEVTVLRIEKVNNKPSAWFDKKIIDTNNL